MAPLCGRRSPRVAGGVTGTLDQPPGPNPPQPHSLLPRSRASTAIVCGGLCPNAVDGVAGCTRRDAPTLRARRSPWGGPEEAIRQQAADWAEVVRRPWASSRTPGGRLSEALRRARTLSTLSLWPTKRQIKRRAGGLAGAANLGRTWAAAGVEPQEADRCAEDNYGTDREAVTESPPAYEAAGWWPGTVEDAVVTGRRPSRKALGHSG